MTRVWNSTASEDILSPEHDETTLPPETVEEEGFNLAHAAAIAIVFGIPLFAVVFGKEK